MANYKVTILTATYNRRKYLSKLFESLCQQTNQDFQWLIIDDGSFDNTEQYIHSLIENGQKFMIEYHKKVNGGKHTALNYSHPYIKGELVFMVDSDDFLVNDAVEKIVNEWHKYKSQCFIGVLSFRKQINGSKPLSALVKEPYIEDDITFRVNHHIVGDRCEVIRSDLFKKYPFPEFPNERFMGEGWLFRNIAYEHKTVYLNSPIYICEYLESGLSQNGRLLRMECPYGMMENCKSFFVPMVNWKVQLKEMIGFGVYGLCAGLNISKIASLSGRKLRQTLIMPISSVLFIFWSIKYGFKRS